MRKGKNIYLLGLASIVMIYVLCLHSLPLQAKDAKVELVDKLESNTAFHWGTDCLVWIVHYPEDIVDPWVSIEASRQGLGKEEREAYRQAFVKDLKMKECEPFLMTIYNFGTKPLDLKPLSKHLFMLLNGKKISLSAYDSKFDEPISGILQGLIFFPKVGSKDFTITLTGISPREMFFSFDSGKLQNEDIKVTRSTEETGKLPSQSKPVDKVQPKQYSGSDEIVVKLPSSEEKSEQKKEDSSMQQNEPIEPSDNSLDAESKSNASEGFALSPAPDPLLKAQETKHVESETDLKLKEMLQDAERETSLSKEDVVTLFVESWVNGDLDTMYSLLDSTTKERYSTEDFREIAMESNIRWAFKDGYNITWIDETKAKVSGIQKLLLVKVERSKVVRLVQERRRWHVVW